MPKRRKRSTLTFLKPIEVLLAPLVRTVVDGFKPSHQKRVGDDGYLDFDRFGAVQLIYTTDGQVDWHTDDELPRWSTILIVRNDKGSIVEAADGSHTRVLDQPVGTIMVLAVRRRHRLRLPPRKAHGVWAALVVDCASFPTRRKFLQTLNKRVMIADRPAYRECASAGG